MPGPTAGVWSRMSRTRRGIKSSCAEQRVGLSPPRQEVSQPVQLLSAPMLPHVHAVPTTRSGFSSTAPAVGGCARLRGRGTPPLTLLPLPPLVRVSPPLLFRQKYCHLRLRATAGEDEQKWEVHFHTRQPATPAGACPPGFHLHGLTQVCHLHALVAMDALPRRCVACTPQDNPRSTAVTRTMVDFEPPRRQGCHSAIHPCRPVGRGGSAGSGEHLVRDLALPGQRSRRWRCGGRRFQENVQALLPQEPACRKRADQSQLEPV